MAKTQDYRLGEFTFPRGWFVVADGSRIGGAAVPERFFGEEVVLYRGASGKVVMLDAYCPHMGTHLGRNKTASIVVRGRHLDGDCIRCPFHGWRFGPDGKCNEIPFYDGPIPEKARVRSWHVVERFGIVFCWHDPEGLAPDIDLPEFAEWDDPRWVRWQLDDLGTLPVHPQEVVDNTADIRHLSFLHGSSVRWYENEVEGPFLHQRQGGEALTAGEHAGLAKFSTLVRYEGPGLLTSRYFMNDDQKAGMAQLIAHTPIDDGTTRLWQASMVKSPESVLDDEVRAAARAANEVLKAGLMEDFEVWANKRPALQILQMPTDGPFGKNRIWYSQFYNPRAKTAQILARATGVHTVKGCPSVAEYAAQEEPVRL
jgi:3-ketosteroid 9alpha-monooxygenase subunit A